MKNLLTLAVLGAIAVANAQNVRINEMLVDPRGTDNGVEFVELSGDAGASLAGLTFLAIEGDGSAAGTIDQVWDLGSLSLGSNGLLLRRDSATVLDPAPDAATTLVVADFTPDIENGSNTFAIVRNFTGALGNDLDTNNDGVLDMTMWDSVVDAIGKPEDDDTAADDFGYGANLGFVDFPILSSLPGDFTAPRGIFRGGNGAWYGADSLTLVTDGTKFIFDADRTVDVAGNLVDTSLFERNGMLTDYFTPGSANPTAVPEPATMAILGLGAAALLRRRAR